MCNVDENKFPSQLQSFWIPYLILPELKQYNEFMYEKRKGHMANNAQPFWQAR